jgi:hypothetical protein
MTMWPSPFHNTWESDEDFLNEQIPQDQFHSGTYWDDTWNSPPGQWYSPGSELQPPIFGEDDTWDDVADAFGGMSEDERFEMDEIELGRRRGRRSGRGRRPRPRIVVLPGGKEEKMDEVLPNRKNPNKGVVRVAVKTGFPHQVERRAVKRAKRVLKSKGYQGVETQATVWFPIITPVGPIPYNYKGYTPVRVHFKSSGQSGQSDAAPRRGRGGRSRSRGRDAAPPPREEEYYDEPMPTGDDDWAQDVAEPGDDTFDQFFGLDLLDTVDQGNQFLD